MAEDPLDLLERRCREAAPDVLHLVAQLRAQREEARTLATSLILDEPVALEDGHGSVEAEVLPTIGSERYLDLGPLAEGGMGEVRRVRDRELAMKLVRAELMGHPEALARFVEEAQAAPTLRIPHVARRKARF